MSEEIKKKEGEEIKEEKSNFVTMETKVVNDMVITINGTDGRVYRFSVPFHSPLQECYNAAVNAANEVARLFNEAIDKQRAADKEVDKKEESKVDEKTD